MVAIKRNSVAKKKLGRGGHFMTFTGRGNMSNGTFSTLCFATARERERRDCLVAKTIYFNISKLLRPGNIANGEQNPFESIKFAILSRSSFFTHSLGCYLGCTDTLIYAFDFLNDEREDKRKTGDAATCTID